MVKDSMDGVKLMMKNGEHKMAVYSVGMYSFKTSFNLFFKDVNTAVRKVQRSVTRHRMPAKD